MSWGLRFRIRQTLKGSLWVLPLVGGLAGLVLSDASVWLESATFVPHGWDYSTETASTVLTTVVGATVGLTGFVVTVSVLVVQMATGTFSARYMRLWYRDGVLKATLAVLVGTLAFSYSLLRRIDDGVPDLGVTMAGFLLGVGADPLSRLSRPVRPSTTPRQGRRARRAGRARVTPGHGRACDDASPLRGRRRARGDPRPRTEPRRPRQAVRCRSGRRRRRPACLGDPSRCHRRDAARGRELRLLRRRPARGARRGAVPGDRRAASRRQVGTRDRANDRPGPGLRAPDPRRHRDQGVVSRRQRPDDGRAGDRPPRRHARVDRQDAGARRALGVSRRGEQPPSRDARPTVRGLPLARRHRDPRVRRLVDPGRPAAPSRAARARVIRAARVRSRGHSRARAAAAHGCERRLPGRPTPISQRLATGRASAVRRTSTSERLVAIDRPTA